MATARDIAIIVLAVESIIVGGLLIYLIFQIRNLLRMLEEESKPILNSTRETVGTVRGTTSLLSETLVKPVVEVAGYVAGVRQVLRTLFGGATEDAGQPERATSAEPEESTEDLGVGSKEDSHE